MLLSEITLNGNRRSPLILGICFDLASPLLLPHAHSQICRPLKFIAHSNLLPTQIRPTQIFRLLKFVPLKFVAHFSLHCPLFSSLPTHICRPLFVTHSVLPTHICCPLTFFAHSLLPTLCCPLTLVEYLDGNFDNYHCTFWAWCTTPTTARPYGSYRPRSCKSCRHYPSSWGACQNYLFKV